MSLWFMLIDVLLNTAGLTAASAVAGSANRSLSPLELEFEALKELMLPYDLSLTMSHTAREAMEALNLSKTETTEYFRKHIREPIGRMIRDDKIETGDRTFIMWDNRIVLEAKRRTA